MSDQYTLLVVVDPTQDNHVALERAILTSRLRAVSPKLKVFVGIDADATPLDADNQDLYRDNNWLENLKKPLEEEGLDYTLVICWATQWHEAVLREAKRTEADLILVPDYSAKHRRSRFTDSKWQLLRHAKCPVLVVRPGNSQRKVVLAAVKMQDSSKECVALNENILTRGQATANRYGADFHVVNAYTSSTNLPGRDDISREINVDSKKIYLRQGPPEEVIAQVADEIDADVVVIGTLKRRGMRLTMRGNTSERIMTKVKQDVLTLN